MGARVRGKGQNVGGSLEARALSSLGGMQFSHLEESCWFTGMGMDGQISEEGQHLEGTLAVTESCAWRLPCGLC